MQRWLKNNKRPFHLVSGLGSGFLVLGILLVCIPIFGFTGFIAGTIILVMSTLALIGLQLLMRQSRLAWQGEDLLVGLDWFGYQRVPLEIVECFFIGQGASMMPDEEGNPGEAVTVVVRLADAAKDWHRRDVNPKFGQWCDGYITIRGTWSEPLDGDKLKEMNALLLAAKKRGK
ncbi:MAG: hypothetical protein COA78_33050 [Blastopirellula sp.]|nr:MAG: hypothetical protein COA78_33050 [Blastopirellula sp.]